MEITKIVKDYGVPKNHDQMARIALVEARTTDHDSPESGVFVRVQIGKSRLILDGSQCDEVIKTLRTARKDLAKQPPHRRTNCYASTPRSYGANTRPDSLGNI